MKKWIIIGVIIIIIVGSTLVYRYFNREGGSDEFSASESGLSYSGDMGQLNIGYIDPTLSDFGIPLYPGARAVSDKSSGEVDINGQKFLMSSFTSGDSKDKIVSFYQSQIEGAVVGTLDSGQIQTVIKAPNGSSVGIGTQGSHSYLVLIKPL